MKQLCFLDSRLHGNDNRGVFNRRSNVYVKYPKVAATQVVLEGDMDSMTGNGIRVCFTHYFFKKLRIKSIS